nr:hypothetical protein [Tanacetum cinerariifolium]
MDVTRETGVISPTDLPILSRGSSEGHSYPVCTTYGCRHPGECRRAAGTCFKCGQAGHLQKDCKKNTTASTSGQADKKPGASGRVFAITEDHATKTSERLADIASPDSRKDSRGVLYQFWAIGCWWKSPTGHYSYLA